MIFIVNTINHTIHGYVGRNRSSEEHPGRFSVARHSQEPDADHHHPALLFGLGLSTGRMQTLFQVDCAARRGVLFDLSGPGLEHGCTDHHLQADAPRAEVSVGFPFAEGSK